MNMENINNKIATRYFTEEFKIEVANFVMQHPEMKISQIAKDFDISDTSVRDWVNKYVYGKSRSKVKPTKQVIVKSNEVEISKELHKLRMENEILRRAMGILAKDTPPKGYTR